MGLGSGNAKTTLVQKVTDRVSCAVRLGGMGVAIVSTSRGVISDRDARKQKIGGEVMAYVW